MARPLVLRVLVFLAIVLAVADARASPRARSDEDLLGDEEIDPEDLVGRATVGRAATRTAPGGEAWVSLAGFTRSTIAGERELGGMLVVGLPLDRFARVGARAAAASNVTTSAAANVVPVVAVEEPAVGVTPRLAR
ncbi:MAG: hypothetical protein JWP87_2313, partial [Labilithrix sp.]|nr:hypothetical protein [Labilithrix sp.]